MVVDEIWSCYDVDGDGMMDKEEVRQFVKEYMPEFEPGFVYSKQVFEKMFLEMDDDCSGSVDSQELAQFVIALLNKSNCGHTKNESKPAIKDGL